MRPEIGKDILVQYCEMQQEIKDLQKRIEKDRKKLKRIEREGEVSDTVTGSKDYGIIGTVKVTGFPMPEYEAVKDMIRKRTMKLQILEGELREAVGAVDDYIASIPKSDLRMIFRFYYVDGLNWEMVAMQMNYAFPKKKTAYTGDSCRKRHDRYLGKK